MSASEPTYATLIVTRDARGIAHLTLNRPDKRNALSAEMLGELVTAARALGADPSIRAVVLAAAGDVFCAGGDLEWMRQQMAADPLTRRRQARSLADMLAVLNTLPKPLIGKVQGNAFGGGVGLMSVCDVVVARRGTQFGLTEVKLGLIPATIGPYVVARMGEGLARRVFFSGRLFDAEEAQRLHLVARIAEADELDAAIDAEVAPYLVALPEAVAAAKALTRALGPRIDDQVIEDTVDRLVKVWEGNEAKTAIDAFFARTQKRG